MSVKSLPVTLELIVNVTPTLGIWPVRETEMKTEQIRELIKRRMAMEEEASKEELCVQAAIERHRQAELAKVKLAKQDEEARARAEQEKAEAEQLKVVHAERARAEEREHARELSVEGETRKANRGDEGESRAGEGRSRAAQGVREELARAEAEAKARRAERENEAERIKQIRAEAAQAEEAERRRQQQQEFEARVRVAQQQAKENERQVASTVTKTPEPASATGKMPSDEYGLIAAVERARSAYKVAANDMVRGARGQRELARFCAVLKGLGAVNWVGKISTLSSNSEGKGVLEIEIANDIHIKTWNNALSDISDQTLIDPGSTLFAKISALKVGQKVVFQEHLLVQKQTV